MQIQPTQNYSLKSNSSQQNPSFQKLIVKVQHPWGYLGEGPNTLLKNKGIRELVKLLEKDEGKDLLVKHNCNHFADMTLNASGPHGSPHGGSHVVSLNREEFKKFDEVAVK